MSDYDRDIQTNAKIAEALNWKIRRKKFKNPRYPWGYRYERGGTAHRRGGGFHGHGFFESKRAAAYGLPNYLGFLKGIEPR